MVGGVAGWTNHNQNTRLDSNKVCLLIFFYFMILYAVEWHYSNFGNLKKNSTNFFIAIVNWKWFKSLTAQFYGKNRLTAGVCVTSRNASKSFFLLHKCFFAIQVLKLLKICNVHTVKFFENIWFCRKRCVS